VEFNPLASSTTEGSTSSADVEAKMKALEERENALAQKETDRSAEWDEKMKTVKGREASLAQEEEKRTASYDERLKDLQDREAALAKREEETKASKGRPDKDSTPADDEAQAKRESEIQRKLDDLKSAEQRLASDRAALEKSKSALTAKEKDLGQRQKEFEDQKASAKKGGGQNRVERPTKSALERKQQDNAALEERLAKLEDRLEQMKKSPDVASDKQQANSKVNGKTSGTALVDGQSPGCGYKHYKPPRKLNRRVIGIVYQ
jgi:chromosome segregation ATPase